MKYRRALEAVAGFFGVPVDQVKIYDGNTGLATDYGVDHLGHEEVLSEAGMAVDRNGNELGTFHLVIPYENENDRDSDVVDYVLKVEIMGPGMLLSTGNKPGRPAAMRRAKK